MKRLFYGGIHPEYKKEMSKKDNRVTAVIPDKVVIPMLQNIGEPCDILVNVGDYVKFGQKIGDGGEKSVPVHASVSGKVIGIEEITLPTLGKVNTVVIENDYKDTTADTEYDTDDIIGTIREAGIVGLGGAAFPTDIKAISAMGKIDTLIANGCECEPYITADDCNIRQNTDELLEGMMILKKLLGPTRAVLAIEDNKKEAIEKVKMKLSSYPEIELAVLPALYPQGSEKQLIQAVKGREVLPGKFPASVGCAVFNVSTCISVCVALKYSDPITGRIVTVTGEGVKHPQNLYAPVGTPASKLIEAAGGLTNGANRVIFGGPMTGIAQSDTDAPICKYTNCVLCLKEDKNLKEENVCIRCGKCVSVCPMRLQPLYLYKYIKSGDREGLDRYHLFDCMSCGSCSYVCPGKLNLTETFKAEKVRQKKEGAK